jgi:hypothetical protein
MLIVIYLFRWAQNVTVYWIMFVTASENAQMRDCRVWIFIVV